MSKQLDKYLPEKVETTLVQAHVNKELVAPVNKYREQKNLTWPELLEALFKRLIAEEKP